jgi:hypothetical protein
MLARAAITSATEHLACAANLLESAPGMPNMIMVVDCETAGSGEHPHSRPPWLYVPHHTQEPDHTAVALSYRTVVFALSNSLVRKLQNEFRQLSCRQYYC